MRGEHSWSDGAVDALARSLPTTAARGMATKPAAAPTTGAEDATPQHIAYWSQTRSATYHTILATRDELTHSVYADILRVKADVIALAGRGQPPHGALGRAACLAGRDTHLRRLVRRIRSIRSRSSTDS